MLHARVDDLGCHVDLFLHTVLAKSACSFVGVHQGPASADLRMPLPARSLSRSGSYSIQYAFTACVAERCWATLRKSWGSPLSVSCTNTWRIGVVVRSCAVIKPSDAPWALSPSRSARPGIPNASAIERFSRFDKPLAGNSQIFDSGNRGTNEFELLSESGLPSERGLRDGSHVEPREGGGDDCNLVHHLVLLTVTSDLHSVDQQHLQDARSASRNSLAVR